VTNLGAVTPPPERGRTLRADAKPGIGASRPREPCVGSAAARAARRAWRGWVRPSTPRRFWKSPIESPRLRESCRALSTGGTRTTIQAIASTPRNNFGKTPLPLSCRQRYCRARGKRWTLGVDSLVPMGGHKSNRTPLTRADLPAARVNCASGVVVRGRSRPARSAAVATCRTDHRSSPTVATR
jgi:hypothetical protein